MEEWDRGREKVVRSGEGVGVERTGGWKEGRSKGVDRRGVGKIEGGCRGVVGGGRAGEG